MRRLILSCALFGLSCLLPATAATLTPAENKLVGQYAVTTQRELATGLQLGKDGRFAWSLAYGNMDQYVAGTWQVKGRQVVLTAAAPEPLKMRLAQLEEVTPEWLPKAGRWVVLIHGVGRVELPPLEIVFLAASGASATAATNRRGEAVVQMPPEQAWTGVKVRRGGSADPWLTLPVPKPVAERRLAVLGIANLQALLPPLFTTLALDIEDGNLAPAGGSQLSGMVYRRSGAQPAR